MRSLLLQGGATDPPRITSRGVALLRMRIVDLRLIGFSGARGNTPPLAKLPTSTADCQEPKDQGRKHWRQDRHQPCQPRPNPKKSKSPLVIPCKFSAVTYSEGLSGTRSVARYALRICAEINDLQSARMSGAECQRGGMPSASPLFTMTVSPPLEEVACFAVVRLNCRPFLFLIGGNTPNTPSDLSPKNVNHS